MVKLFLSQRSVPSTSSNTRTSIFQTAPQTTSTSFNQPGLFVTHKQANPQSSLVFSSQPSQPSVHQPNHLQDNQFRKPNDSLIFPTFDTSPHTNTWPSWPIRRGALAAQTVTQTFTSNAPLSTFFNHLTHRLNNWATNWG